jgi:hypothetical protein
MNLANKKIRGRFKIFKNENKKSTSYYEKFKNSLLCSEVVHYFGNKFGDGRSLLCLVQWCEVEIER